MGADHYLTGRSAGKGRCACGNVTPGIAAIWLSVALGLGWHMLPIRARAAQTVPRAHPAPGAAQQAGAPAADLARRLERGETVTLVALGDSLATGYELADPDHDAYPNVFRTVLQRRYPRAYVRILNAGIPGDTAGGGTRRVNWDVLPHRPDLVIVQFGGNDHGMRRPPEAFRRNLEEIIAEIRSSTTAHILLATPPIIAPHTDTPMVKVVKEVGAAQGIPVADFDGAIRAAGTGPRGPFPLGRHPDARLHAVMARALYEAFVRLIGDRSRLDVAVREGVWEVPQGAPLPVEVQVRASNAAVRPPTPARTLGSGKPARSSPDAASAAGEPVVVVLERNGARQERSVRLGPSGVATVSFRLSPAATQQRTRQERLLAYARQGLAFGYDARRIATAPVLTLDTTAAIGEDALTLWPRRWRGPDDLSATFAVTREGDCLRLAVSVRDDRIAPAARANEGFRGDCVELFLDLRPTHRQARPYWEDGVVGVFLAPTARGSGRVRPASLEPLPTGWEAATATSTRIKGGYRIEARIPLALVRQHLAPNQDRVGFDLCVDDADDDWGRKSQAAWAGGRDDFLDPSLFGVLALQPPPDGRPRVRVAVH